MSLQAAVANADPNRVVEGGARLGQVNPVFSFLDPASPLIAQPTQDFVEDCMRRAPTPGDADHLEEYLALASCCHLFAGWRYLSKACFSLLDGARNTAIHLGYYAELRAAMSLLAANGVGILNSCHFSIDSKQTLWVFGNLQKRTSLSAVKKGNWSTHGAVWKGIHEWCQLPDVSAALLDRFTVLGRDGNTWVRAVSSTNITAVSWAADWAIDLKNLKQDSRARNIATYQPDLDPDAYSPMRNAEFDLVRQLSVASVSEAPGGFSGIDLRLADDLCCKAAEATGISEWRAYGRLSRFLQVHEDLSKGEAHEIVRQLKAAKSMDGGRIVDLANVNNKSVTGVLARAFLLLRLSTMFVRDQWQEIRRRSPKGVAPWQDAMLRSLAENCHLQDSTSAEDVSYEDFILDQQIAVEYVDLWCEDNPVSGHSMWAESTGIPDSLRGLCQLERIGLWALAS